MVVVNINNLTVDDMSCDADWVIIKSGDNTVLISQVVISRINVMIAEGETD